MNDRIASLLSLMFLFAKGKSRIAKRILALELNKLWNCVLAASKHNCSKSEPYSGLVEEIRILYNALVLEDKGSVSKCYILLLDTVGDKGQFLIKTCREPLRNHRRVTIHT